MKEERKFPLIFWEETAEFRRLCQGWERKKQELVKTWQDTHGDGKVGVGGIEPNMSEDGEPVFWINTHPPYEKGRNWSAEEALKDALKYGDSGWCTLDELTQLIEGKGPLLERAMYHQGFRPHKKIPGKWVRLTEEFIDAMFDKINALDKQIRERQVSGQEVERLRKLLVSPNLSYEEVRWATGGNVYTLKADRNGLVYICLEINPIYAGPAEGLEYFGSLVRQRGHIAKQQEGYILAARNLRIGKQEVIHLLTTKPDETHVEVVWPTRVCKENLYSLADDLVSRVTGSIMPSDAKGAEQLAQQ